MRQQPIGRFALARAEQADAVQEAVQARRQRVQPQRAGRVEQDEPVDRFVALLDELARDFVRDDAAGGPAAEAVRAAGLPALHFGEVEGGDGGDAAGEVGGGPHEGAVEAVDGGGGRVDGRDGRVGGGGAGAVGEEEEGFRRGFGVALEEEGGGFWRRRARVGCFFEDGDNVLGGLLHDRGGGDRGFGFGVEGVFDGGDGRVVDEEVWGELLAGGFPEVGQDGQAHEGVHA